MWTVLSLPQNVRHFLCKHHEEWLPREQSKLQALRFPTRVSSNKKLGKLETGPQGLKECCEIISQHNNLLLTEREGRTGEYWPEVVAVRTERSEVRTKTTEGQYSPVRLELARLVSSLLYGTQAMLVLNFPAFENKKYTAYDRFHGNGPYGKIPTKKEPIRTLGFALPYIHGSFSFVKVHLTQILFSAKVKL